MLRDNARLTRNIEALIADQDDWNEAHPDPGDKVQVDGDHALTLMLQWLDQHRKELEAKQHPLSEMPPKLAKIMENL